MEKKIYECPSITEVLICPEGTLASSMTHSLDTWEVVEETW
jgi:hypothetical protein